MKKTSVQSNINLETLAGGAFAEKLNEALMQVAENIQNPNTEATTKRQIQITLKFAPNKTRQLVSTQIAVTTKLAATEAIDTQMIMGINMRTGQIEIAEYDGQIRGQMSFNDLQAQEQPAEPAQATTPAANETQPAARAEEQQPAPTGKPLDLKNRNKKPAEVPTDQEQEKAEAAAGELVPGRDFDPETGEVFKENREDLRDRMLIQVVNETKVLLYSGLLAERDRETLFEVNALLPRFEYGREYDQESFLISMQSCFKESDDREAVTMLASNIVNTQEATFSDNGTTQQAVMKTGITTKDNVLVPNPVNLIPYRTFLEVEQPASDFVFRVSEGRGGAPVFKLVAADGGVWKSQAVANVKAYLTEALKDIPDRDKITIIA